MSDAVVIGAGHNGLVAAWYLARAGLEVVVLERRGIVGGACTTEELGPGYRCSTSAFACSVLHPAVMEEMDLARHGLELLPATSFFNPFPDGSYLLLTGDRAQDRASIAQFSNADAQAFERYAEELEPLLRYLSSLQTRVPPDPGSPHPRDAITAVFMQRGFRKLGDSGQRLLLKAMTLSAVDFLGHWFESDQVIAAFAAGGTSGVAGGPRTAGTALPLLHFAVGNAAGDVGSWSLARGGMGSVTSAMAQACREAGVEIRTSSAIEGIDVAAGRVCGVRTADGTAIRAPLVLSNADPGHTLLDLLPEGSLPESFRGAISRIRATGNMGKVNLALSERPRFVAGPGGDAHLSGGVQIIGHGLRSLDQAYRQYEDGKPSAQPHLNAVIQSIVDRSLAPEGGDVLTASIKYLPRLYQAREWSEDDRRRVLDGAVETLGRYAPNLPAAVVHSQLITPLDFERDFRLPGGSATHGDMDIGQLFSARPILGCARYRTPVSGLYLCGAGTHPGGGVSGVPGRNAAHQVLRDRRRSWPKRLGALMRDLGAASK